MKVFLTGAFGNVGLSAIYELAEKGYHIRCFDLPTRTNKRIAQKLAKYYDLAVVWGDLRDAEAVRQALQGCDAVLHVAFIIPPHSDRNPTLAYEVNVKGTQNILAAIPDGARLVFTSSVALYGNQQHLEPPRTAADPIVATDPYTEHKIACEKMIRESNLNWCIFRLGAVQPLNLGNVDPLMFEVPYNQRIEFVHTRDVGLALANAVEHPAIIGKTLLIGGGAECQMLYEEYIGTIFDKVGIPRLPSTAFSHEPFHTDWLDTTESQNLLTYQR